jgi:hypothetical protein
MAARPIQSHPGSQARREWERILNLTDVKALVVILGIFLASDVALAQSASAPAADPAWSVTASADTYVLPDDHNYVQPSINADRGRLHLEGRYNYESLSTGSAWVGLNFSGGERVQWEVTPMFGGVFGDTDGVAPGVRAAIRWRRLEFSTEDEYVFDAGDRADSFFYSWSELTLSPADWWYVGLVTQRTHIYQSEHELERGFLAGVSLRRLNLAAYVFNPDDERPRFVFSAEFAF